MTDENRFCTACGAKIPAGSRFCPECGRPLGEGYENPATVADRGRMTGYQRKSSIPLFILLYGAFGLVFGLLTLSDSISMSEQSYNQMLDTISGLYGVDASSLLPEWSDALKVQMVVSGAFMVASPVCALASYYFCWKDGPWKIALVLCVLASVLTLGMCAYVQYAVIAIPMFIIGLFVTFRLYNESDRFSS